MLLPPGTDPDLSPRVVGRTRKSWLIKSIQLHMVVGRSSLMIQRLWFANPRTKGNQRSLLTQVLSLTLKASVKKKQNHEQSLLVGGFNPFEKILVNWDDYSRYMDKSTCSKPIQLRVRCGPYSPLNGIHQPVIICSKPPTSILYDTSIYHLVI